MRWAVRSVPVKVQKQKGCACVRKKVIRNKLSLKPPLCEEIEGNLDIMR